MDLACVGSGSVNRAVDHKSRRTSAQQAFAL
jgi:hypothetical protein